MPKTEIKNGAVSFEMTCTPSLPATGSDFINLVAAVDTLHRTVPLRSYTIERTGETDVWVVAAVTQDDRHYATTVTITAGVVRYTLTSLPAATDVELDAFLTLVQLFTRVLKLHNVSIVEIAWS